MELRIWRRQRRQERVLFPAVGQLAYSTAHSIPAGAGILHLPLISSHSDEDRRGTESGNLSWHIWQSLRQSHSWFLASVQSPCLE